MILKLVKLSLVALLGLLALRALFIYLYPDAPAYADRCVWDGCPEGPPPWTRWPHPK